MHLISLFLVFTTFLATALGAVKNTTREFHLKTTLKPNQAGKERFANLYLEAYHTGAGLNDAVMVPKEGAAIKGFLNGTNGLVKGTKYQNMVFDLGNTFPYTMVMAENVNFYAAWEPVRVNAGGGASDPKGYSGFFIDGTGLQWTNALHKPPGSSASSFGGWLGEFRAISLSTVMDFWLIGGVQFVAGGMARRSCSSGSATTMIPRRVAVRMCTCVQSTSEASQRDSLHFQHGDITKHEGSWLH